ncbi:hypothetical protein [Nonomuraea gerenzanensis]|uniref:Uncharacterized protein n=1 Tax=Nonomuraea gerenzanensis TaxID=93944 RepID=A0A1M4EFJ3_9ACTN|nr:hypothetical protein [Nonomuraea gerenzanensis]UBU09090.1 hypothetical protein LCN96_32485 [Nonomuraea gerenzanensis]SBO97476.1 hypothetical protein BN4615_P6992 [Nonomuraea gerenzanensis]
MERAGLARRIGCLAWLLVPFVLPWAVAETPAWVNDFEPSRMVERAQECPRLNVHPSVERVTRLRRPPPPGTSIIDLDGTFSGGLLDLRCH